MLFPSIPSSNSIPYLYLIQVIHSDSSSNSSNVNCHWSSICMKNIVIPICFLFLLTYLLFYLLLLLLVGPINVPRRQQRRWRLTSTFTYCCFCDSLLFLLPVAVVAFIIPLLFPLISPSPSSIRIGGSSSMMTVAFGSHLLFLIICIISNSSSSSSSSIVYSRHLVPSQVRGFLPL